VSAEAVLDLARLICSLDELGEGNCRGFTLGCGDWPLQGLIVRIGTEIRAYRNRCPHAGHPLNLRPHDFLTADRSLLLCHSHGALFEKRTGLCVAGPCPGRMLESLPLLLADRLVLLAPGYVPQPD
jgi:nitrite reductase/ring-hydroxylating ferredoxin subunit